MCYVKLRICSPDRERVCCAQVLFEGILLKPSMVTPGADSSKREKPEVVADYTLKLLKRRVPPAVPGEKPPSLQPTTQSSLHQLLLLLHLMMQTP